MAADIPRYHPKPLLHKRLLHVPHGRGGREAVREENRLTAAARRYVTTPPQESERAAVRGQTDSASQSVSIRAQQSMTRQRAPVRVIYVDSVSIEVRRRARGVRRLALPPFHVIDR